MHGRFLIAAMMLGLPQAHAGELLINGGFEEDAAETASIAGWTVDESAASGGVWATDQASAPASGAALPAAPGGSFLGLIDAYSPGAYALSQVFSTAAVGSAVLSFRLFVNNPDGTVVDVSGLDETTGGDFRDNQHVRVDLLADGASPFATDASVLRSLYLGGDSTSGFEDYVFDLGSELAGGGTYALRFAAVGNLGQFQVGVDDVSLRVTSVPEPATAALFLAGLGLIGATVRRRA